MDRDRTARRPSMTQRRKAALVLAGVAAVIVAAGLLVPGAHRDTTPPPAEPVSATPAATTTTAPRQIVGSISRRTVLLVGDDTGRQIKLDSRAFQFFDDTQLSSGLARPDFFDWPHTLAALLPTLPDRATVVIAIGGNDAQSLVLPGGPPIPFGDPRWQSTYAALVGTVMDQVAASRHPLVWIGPIDSPDPAIAARLQVVRGAITAAAAGRPVVQLVDTWALFRGPANTYAAALDIDGVSTRVRSADGYHLNDAGTQRLSEAVRQAFVALLAPAANG